MDCEGCGLRAATLDAPSCERCGRTAAGSGNRPWRAPPWEHPTADAAPPPATAGPLPHHRARAVALLSASMVLTAGITLALDAAVERRTVTASAGEPLAMSSPAPSGLDGASLARTNGAAVFSLESDGCGARERGTAFAIDEHHLVTNRHVVRLDTTPAVVDRDGRRVAGRVVGWREEPDLAVVRVDEALPRHLEWADPAVLSEGQELLALGYPAPGFEFAATPAAIVSFEARDGARPTIRAAGPIDRGNSGGPAVTATGEVAGVVTSIALDEGFQVVPLLLTAAALAADVDAILAAPTAVEAVCDPAIAPDGGFHAVDHTVEPSRDRPATGQATLELLHGLCADGDGRACDELYRRSTPGSEHERFADSCGGRRAPGRWCAEVPGLTGS